MTASTEQKETRNAWMLMALLCSSFMAFAWHYVPRLNNYVMSDREFTGWTGPIAERLASGAKPYVDFVLPIPPGSMVLLAAVQTLAGRPLLLQELWVAAISHLCMALLAFLMVSPLTTKRNAVLVSITTLVMVAQTPKECIYDHTSQLVAWTSIVVGVRALLRESGTAPRHWALAGALASFTLFFKQSTATGIVLGWVLGVAYLGIVARFEAGPAGLRARVKDALACAAGGLAGFGLVLTLLLALGTTLPAFFQAVLGDAPELKGGQLTLLKNLYNYVVRHDAIRVALVPTALAAAVAVRMVRERGSLHAGDEPSRPGGLDRRTTALLALGILALFVPATLLLAGEVRAMQRLFTATVDTLRNVPAYGFVFGTVFFVGHLLRSETNPEKRRVGHAMNALVIVVMTCSMIYNTSFIHFSPFYYNNAEIPLALMFCFMATERARLPLMTVLFLALPALSLYGAKLNRALSADHMVTAGHWAGLRVNYRGIELLHAASRVRELTEPAGTVLVLPEDVELTGLFGRPRPPVKGAILFVDQYPRRLLAGDIEALDAHLPDVIVVHPRRRRDWHTLYNTWSKDSAAQAILEHVLDDVLPRHYELDSVYPTIYFWDQGQLEVWARKDD